MTKILSVDLAYKRYTDIGVVLLERPRERCAATRLNLFDDLAGTQPEAAALAAKLVEAAEAQGASAIALDGPQAWKAPENGLAHQRICERAFATPGKTGLPGQCKPRPYLPFIAFSITVFDALAARGWSRLGCPDARQEKFTIEVFPTAAWKGLGLRALPGKAASTAETVQAKLAELRARLDCQVTPPRLSHDELQALVGGLAVLDYVDGRMERVRWAGQAPCLLDGHWREGWIFNTPWSA